MIFQGVCGQHAQAYQQGHPLIEGLVLLDPDVRAYFPDGESVNRAPRGLIQLLPEQGTAHEIASAPA